MLFTLGYVLELDSLFSNRCMTLVAVQESEIVYSWQSSIIPNPQPTNKCISERFFLILGLFYEQALAILVSVFCQ